jgi:hypothetical protein
MGEKEKGERAEGKGRKSAEKEMGNVREKRDLGDLRYRD